MPVEQPFGQRRVIIPVLERIFGATYADMRRMETLLRGSDPDWVLPAPTSAGQQEGPARYRLDTLAASTALASRMLLVAV